MKIRMETFHGEVPRSNERHLRDQQATIAKNTKLWSGAIRPWKGNLEICSPAHTPRPIQSIYLFGKDFDPTGFFFQFSEAGVDVVKGQVGGDDTERTYWTGGPEGQPQISDKHYAIDGEEETWAADQFYGLTNRVVGISTSGVWFETTTAGQAGSSEPSWDLGIGNTTADGTVVWTTRALTPSARCDDLPLRSYNLGVPAPSNAPGVARVGDSGTIAGFSDFEVANNQEKQHTAPPGFTHDIVGDGSAQTYTLNISVDIRIHDNWEGATPSINFVLHRDTSATNPVDNEVQVEAAWNQLFEPEGEASGVTEGRIFATATLSEAGSLNGAHQYGATVILTDITPAELSLAITATFRGVYGSNATFGEGITIDLGATIEENPFELGDQILIEGVVGVANSTFELINGVHNVAAIGPTSISIAIDGLTAADYSSGGTWTHLPNDQITFERSYVYTYIARMALMLQEGPPSPPSKLVGITDEDDVVLDSLSAPPAGFNVTRMRFYRTVQGEDSANFKFIAETGVVTAFTDTLKEGSDEIGELLQSTLWAPPPTDMHSIVQMPNGIMAGLSKNEVLFSEPFQPHAWPSTYRLSMNYQGVATAVFGNTLVVMTNGYPYVVTGNDPSFMAMDKLEVGQSCVSKRSVVDAGYAVVYASPDGIMLVGPGTAQLITENLFTKDEWAQLNPTSIHAARYDDRYVAFYTDVDGVEAGFVFDPKEPQASLTFLDYYMESVFTFQEDGELYMVSDPDTGDADDRIVQFDADADEPVDFIWRSKIFKLPRRANPGAAQIHAESYPVSFLLFSVERDEGDTTADQYVLRDNRLVYDEEPFRLPSGYLAAELAFEVRGNREIEGVYIVESLEELQRV